MNSLFTLFNRVHATRVHACMRLACMRLYGSLCRSLGRSFRLSVITLFFSNFWVWLLLTNRTRLFSRVHSSSYLDVFKTVFDLAQDPLPYVLNAIFSPRMTLNLLRCLSIYNNGHKYHSLKPFGDLLLDFINMFSFCYSKEGRRQSDSTRAADGSCGSSLLTADLFSSTSWPRWEMASLSIPNCSGWLYDNEYI